ncbi:hypothetical protein RhiirC2_794131 [Rhizophagus irregularis]|uniref:DUF8211 domain-containing protein n=1 Tax=Rhizophagus irregularis TaxID=588596 RepID=A0A2N1ME43_9GLOM|nr:hypothetical protein RhiirC2_794131 [Rhizophagus irregularis]
MYHKRIDNFQVHHNNPKVNRSKKNVDLNESHRFLFLPSQYINKPIQHLKYHKKSPPHIKKDYRFPIPSDYIKISPVDQKTSTVGNSLPPPPHTEENPIPSEEGKTWHPTLNILIDDDLFLYVPNKPIYEQELAQFNINYSLMIDHTAPHHQYKGDTSDDTKELKHRPNKHTTLHHKEYHLKQNGCLDSAKRIKVIYIPDLMTEGTEDCRPSTSY